MMVAFFRLNCPSNDPKHLQIFNFFSQLAFIYIDDRPTKNQPLSETPTPWRIACWRMELIFEVISFKYRCCSGATSLRQVSQSTMGWVSLRIVMVFSAFAF
jgi:hypothetical protein